MIAKAPSRAERRPRGRLLAPLAAIGLSLSCLAAPGTARAQSEDEIRMARQSATEGLAAYKARDYQKALRLFEQARALYPSAQILRMTGYSLLALEQWEKAAETLEAALASSAGPLNDKDRKEVEQQLDLALSHIGTLSVKTTVAGTELVVDDGEPRKLPLERPLRLPPGKHKVTVRAADHETASQEVELVGGKTAELTLDPEKPAQKPAVVAPPPAPPKPKPAATDDEAKRSGFPGKTLGAVSIGTGVALGVGALTTSLVAGHLRGNVEEDIAAHEKAYGKNCSTGDFRLCSFDREVINSDADRADSLRNASIWLTVGAGVFVAGGVALILLSPQSSAPPPDETGLSAARPRAARAAGPSAACAPLPTGFVSCAGTF